MKNKFLYIHYILGALLMSVSFDSRSDLTINPAYLVKNAAEVAALFPKTVEEMDARYAEAKKTAIEQIDEILAIPVQERTFENTVLAFDKAQAYFEIYGSIIASFKRVCPDEAMLKKTNEILLDVSNVTTDLFQTNRKMYELIKEFQNTNKEPLNEERAYYLENLMADFKMSGFDLDADNFQKMLELRKKISALGLEYQTNMAQDNSNIVCSHNELMGIDADFINNLKQTEEGYILGCDYPTASQVLSNCSVEKTRQKYHEAFQSRAFPQNIEILNKLVNLRHELAELLGYASYAELDIMNTMAGSIDCVEQFLDEISSKGRDRVIESWKILMKDLPEAVSLTPEGKVKPWDTAYLGDHYLKRSLDIDHEKIAEYFPMEQTVQGLLDIYEQFFNIKFAVVKGETFWDPSVQMIEVKDIESGNVIGYVLVDLFPRQNKYTHACCFSVIPPMNLGKDNTYSPALALVIANFSKSTKEKPSLLKHQEVVTFFHEFGHAIHALLGKAEMPTKAAYNVKFDFVETPSQLLEEWMWDAKILKLLGRHYKTGDSLPDDLIEKLISTKTINEGLHIDRQLQYTAWSLNLYKKGQNKDFLQIKKDAYEKSSQVVAYNESANAFCAFTHLTDYASKYYTYLWSEQMAKKIFNYIKTHGGLLDPKMGKRYISKIIGRGGSCDPKQMIEDFMNEDSAV